MRVGHHLPHPVRGYVIDTPGASVAGQHPAGNDRVLDDGRPGGLRVEQQSQRLPLVAGQAFWVLRRFAGADVDIPDETVHPWDTLAAVRAYRNAWTRIAAVAAAILDRSCRVVGDESLIALSGDPERPSTTHDQDRPVNTYRWIALGVRMNDRTATASRR